MPENRWQAALQAFGKLRQDAQNGLSRLAGGFANKSPTPDGGPVFLPRFFRSPLKIDSVILQPNAIVKSRTIEVNSDAPVTKEELGRSTWTFLHTLAAQYPGEPTSKQKKDVKELIDILSRMYPCKECADHFKNILSKNPVRAESQAEFAQWLCNVHNDVNKSLRKKPFPCQDVDRRWGKMECEQGVCMHPGTAVDRRH